ncbi:MAG: hypothetical protein LBR95_07415 [Azoarcus sp.]|jgi:hypothetical protein|nr:hypothetical protein [Azoarcus sp.]
MELEIYSAFKAAGVPDENARAVIESINKTIDQRYALHSQQLAAQGDVEKVRIDVAQVRTEVEKVRTEIAKTEANLIKWNVGAIIAAAGLAMAIARVFLAAG